MKYLILVATLSLVAPQAKAQVFLNPSIGVGYNSVQHSYFRVGADVGYEIDELWAAGVGGYYSSGSHPSDDREIGAGPFVSFTYPLLSFLDLQFRQDLLYIDERNPIQITWNPDSYDYQSLNGLESATYFGVHLAFTRNFGVSAGYRAVLGLTKSTLSSGRSSSVLGITFGF